MAQTFRGTPLVFQALFALAALAGLATSAPAVCHAGGGPQNVLVVINSRSTDSVEVGEYYVSKRDIPAVNVCRIACPTDLTVPFAVAKSKILDPIRRYMERNGIDDHIDYIVTTQGMPIRVNVGGAGGHFSMVSLQALIQLMETDWPGKPQTKMPQLRNPYFRSGKAFHHKDPYGDDNFRMYVVASLQAFTVDDCKALVDRAIASDEGPKGNLYIFQDADGNAKVRNAQYHLAAAELDKMGFQTMQTTSGADKVKDQKGIMGWMCGGAYSKLKVAELATNEFAPGAMVDALQSFGAVPNNFEENTGNSQFPITHFIRHGCTVIYGAVAEPYTSAFAPVILFFPYVQGFNAGETMYMMFPLAYWMNMMVGDPLTMPYVKRPALELTNADDLEKPINDQGVVTFRASAGQAGSVQGIEIYLDGIRTHVLPGTATSAPIDTSKLKNGSHELRVVAIGEDPVQAQTYVKTFVNVANTRLFVVSQSPGDGLASVAVHETLRVEFNREVPSDEAGKVKLSVTADGRAVNGEWQFDHEAGMATFEPADASGQLPPASDIVVRAEFNGSELAVAKFHTAIKSLGIAGPEAVQAGESVTLTIVAEKPDGRPDSAYAGRVSLAIADQQAQAEANHTYNDTDRGTWKAEVEFRTAGIHEITVKDADSGAEATMTVTVRPGPFAGVMIDAPDSWPLGAPLSVRLKGGDKFGNVLDSAEYDGRVVLRDPDGNIAARVPASLQPGVGEALVRDLDITKTGKWTVELDPGNAKAEIEVDDRGVPHCLLIGPFAERDAAKRMSTEFIDERRAEPLPNGIESQTQRIWRRVEVASGQSAFDFISALPGRPTNCAVYAMVYIDALSSTGCDLTLTADDGVKVWVNGRSVFEKDGIAGQEQKIPGIRLKSGTNTLMFKVVQGSGGYSLKFALSYGGKPVEGLVYRVAPKGQPANCTVSGYVRIGKDPLSGARVALRRLENGEPTGGTRRAETGENGLWHIDNLATGRYEVTCETDGADPPRRIVQVIGDHVADVDFSAPDSIPPTVTLSELADKIVADHEVEADAKDNDAVAKVQFYLDGKPLGAPVTEAPYTVSVGPGTLRPGKYELTCVVTDRAGNATESDEIDFQVVNDRRGPRVTLKTPRRWEGEVEIEVKLRDDVAVAGFTALVDGKSVFTSTKEEDTFKLDCSKLEPGRHEIVIEAKDTAGNVERKSKSFRIR